jgi:hypothetical protein
MANGHSLEERFEQLINYFVNNFVSTVPTKLLGTPPFFQCILMALRVLEKVQILPERLGLDFFS